MSVPRSARSPFAPRARLADVCLARLPEGSLGALGALRASPEIRVLSAKGEVFLSFRKGDERALLAAMAVRGAELFEEREGRVFPLGRRLPRPDPRKAPARALHEALAPAPVVSRAAATSLPSPVRAHLVRSVEARPTTALTCALNDLAKWSNWATTHRLSHLLAARSGERVLVVGEKLPEIQGERLHGKHVLAPLGFRVEPALPEGALALALGAKDDELVVFPESGAIEIVPRSALRPLSRAAVRLAAREFA